MDSSSRLGAVESCDVDSWGGGGWRTKSLILHFFKRTLSSQDSFLVFRKTGGVAMEGEELVDLVVLGVHDNDHQCSAASIEFTTSE